MLTIPQQNLELMIGNRPGSLFYNLSRKSNILGIHDYSFASSDFAYNPSIGLIACFGKPKDIYPPILEISALGSFTIIIETLQPSNNHYIICSFFLKKYTEECLENIRQTAKLFNQKYHF